MAKVEMFTTLPSVPNFIKVGEQFVPLSEFSESELREIGAEWTEELVKKMLSGVK